MGRIGELPTPARTCRANFKLCHGGLSSIVLLSSGPLPESIRALALPALGSPRGWATPTSIGLPRARPLSTFIVSTHLSILLTALQTVLASGVETVVRTTNKAPAGTHRYDAIAGVQCQAVFLKIFYNFFCSPQMLQPKPASQPQITAAQGPA